MARNETDHVKQALALDVHNITGSNLTTAGRSNSRQDLWISTVTTVFLGIVIFVGILGNLLTLVVMSRKSLRKSSVAVYLSSLAVVDTLVLVAILLNAWLTSVNGFAVRLISHTTCKMYYLFFQASYTLTAWLQLFVTGERFIVVSFPLKAKVICTRRNAIVTVVSMVVPVISIYLYSLWGWELASGDRCDITLGPSMRDFMARVAPWFNAVFYSFIPTVGLVVLNTALVFKLYEARRLRHAMSTVAQADQNELQIAVMVFIACLCCLILTVPTAIYNIVFYASEPAFRLSDRMLVTRSLLTSFSTLNYGINFYVYVLSSSKFRRDLQLTFSCIFWSSLVPPPSQTPPCISNPANVCRGVDLCRPSLNETRPRSYVEVEDQSISTLDLVTMARSCDDDDVRGNETIVVWTTRL